MMRSSAFCGVVAYAIYGLLHKDRSQASEAWLEFYAECTCGVMFYASYFLVLMRATPPLGSSAVKRLIWAIDMVANPRGVGTTWQIKNLPPFSRKDPTYVPSRYNFIVQRTISFFLIYTMLKMFKVAHAEIYLASLREGDYNEYKESIIRRIRDVSMHELYIRAWLPFNMFFRTWCIHECFHRLVSVFAVILGDDPRRWPPLDGDIREAYSLRRFWGYGFAFF